MENYHGSSNDKDAQLKRSYESYQSPEEKEEAKKKKKKKQQDDERAKAETAKRSNEKPSEDSWLGEKKPESSKKPPSFLGALLGEEKSETDTEKSASKTTKEKKSAAPATPAETVSSAEVEKRLELSPEEQREAAAAYVAEREARLAAEAAQAEQAHDEVAASEVAANQSFLQRLKAKLIGEQPERSNSELLDEAATETIDDLDDKEISDESIAESAEEVPDATEADSVDDDFEPDENSFTPAAAESEDSTIDEQSPLSTAASTAQPVQSRPSVSEHSTVTDGGGSGGGETPPPLPTDFGGGNEGPNLRFDATANNQPGQPAVGEFTGSAINATGEIARRVERGARRTAGAGEFLLGAFVGYLFGRRRGRLNTEAEHQPAQKQLEKEVKQLQSDIEAREEQVRTVARQKESTIESSSAQTEAQQKAQTETRSFDQSKTEATPSRPEASVKKTDQLADKDISESRTARILDATKSTNEQAPLAQQETETPISSREFAVAAVAAGIESSLSDKSKTKDALSQPDNRQEQQAERIAKRVTTKESIATLPLPQALEQAHQVKFHGETLRDMYEAEKIDEKTLRETLKAFHGGERFEQRLERALRNTPETYASNEMLEREHQNDSGASQQGDIKQSNQPAQPVSLEDTPTSQPIQSDDASDTHLENKDSTDKQSAMRQASIGAAIGIVFVIIIIIFFAFR